MKTRKVSGAAWALGGFAAAGLVWLLVRDSDSSGDAGRLPEELDRALASAAPLQNEEPEVIAMWLAAYRLGFTSRFLRPNDSAYNDQIFDQATRDSGITGTPEQIGMRSCVLYTERARAGTLRPMPLGSAAALATLERAHEYAVRRCGEMIAGTGPR